jgi:hypothetical protein
MWGHEIAGLRCSYSENFTPASQNILFFWLRYKSSAKTYPSFPNQPSPLVPQPAVQPSPLLLQSLPPSLLPQSAGSSLTPFAPNQQRRWVEAARHRGSGGSVVGGSAPVGGDGIRGVPPLEGEPRWGSCPIPLHLLLPNRPPLLSLLSLLLPSP